MPVLDGIGATREIRAAGSDADRIASELVEAIVEAAAGRLP